MAVAIGRNATISFGTGRSRYRMREALPICPGLVFGVQDHAEYGVTFGLWGGDAWDGPAAVSGHVEPDMAVEALALADRCDALDLGRGPAGELLPFGHVGFVLGHDLRLRTLYGPELRGDVLVVPRAVGAGTAFRRISGLLRPFCGRPA